MTVLCGVCFLDVAICIMVECILPNISTCSICEKALQRRLEELTEKTRQAVFVIDDEVCSDEEDVEDDGLPEQPIGEPCTPQPEDATLASEIEALNQKLFWHIMFCR